MYSVRKIHQVRREREYFSYLVAISCISPPWTCYAYNYHSRLFRSEIKGEKGMNFLLLATSLVHLSICATNRISNSTSERADRSSEQIRLENRGREEGMKEREREREKSSTQGSRRRATKSHCKREDFTGSLHAFPRGSKQIRDLPRE